MMMEKMIKHQELANKNHEASLRNLERQIRQLSKQTVAERPTNALPSDTIPNPKEECKAIQFRSGKTLEIRITKKLTRSHQRIIRLTARKK
ncbi:hypothetical protein AHAS_Ahas20G0213700 [Arachis hypogaea]